MVEGCKVAIVGGGPAGLSLATALCGRGLRGVVVIERAPDAGGIPRHCGHYPFGLREFKRLLRGPQYAQRLVQAALAAGVDIRTGTAVTRLHPGGRLSLSHSEKAYDLQAERVVLATGAREASRAQRMISGARPMGVISTGALQGMVFLQGLRPFRRPVILGSELVSLSALMTCRHAGIKPVMMLEEGPHLLARTIMRPYPALRGVPMRFGVQDIRIVGHKTVAAVGFTDASGQTQQVAADGVLVSGHFRPESALIYDSHLAIDPATGGPQIDQFGRCSDPHYFACGNLLRPVETAGWCWQEGHDTAKRLLADLAHPARSPASVALRVDDSRLRYVLPQRLALDPREGGMAQMQLRLAMPASGRLAALSAGKTLTARRFTSRPERRVLLALAPVLAGRPRVDVTLKIT